MNHIFTVEGMTCGHCEKAISKALLASDAHAKISIDRNLNRVEVSSNLARELFAQAMADEGYRVVDSVTHI